ncbi:MAG: ATP-binding cassette domain-containing protein [Candidatus Acetothermia bacterium]
MSKVVQVAELSIYDEEDEVIFENLSFNLGQGEVAQLTGLTEGQYQVLFHVLTGEITPDSGQIVLADRNVVRLSGKKRRRMFRNEVSFLLRDFTLPEGKTVLESLKFKLKLTGPRREEEEKLREVLQLTRLTGEEEKRAQELDSEKRIQVALALSVLNKPKLLICQDPFSSLNSNELDEILEIIAGINSEYGLTVLFLTDQLGRQGEGIKVIESNLDRRVVG